jgi:hypothetical protein
LKAEKLKKQKSKHKTKKHDSDDDEIKLKSEEDKVLYTEGNYRIYSYFRRTRDTRQQRICKNLRN